MDGKPFNRTPCDAALKRASQLARETVGGQIAPIDGAHEIAWLETGDFNDFLKGDRI
jgi:hypothetical protein